MRKTEKFLFFWTEKDIYSNFYLSPLKIKDIKFNCVEQFFMYSKARFFNDIEIADKILKETIPNEQKKLGRKVRNFNQALWDKKFEKIMEIGVYYKFKQNTNLKDQILQTNELELVEASPYDKLYGVGLGENNPKILDKSCWLGENRLGNILMRVRDILKNELNDENKIKNNLKPKAKLI